VTTYPPMATIVHAPKSKNNRSLDHKGQFNGSLGSSDGWGTRTIVVPRYVVFLRCSEWAAFSGVSSLSNTVAGTWARPDFSSRMPQAMVTVGQDLSTKITTGSFYRKRHCLMENCGLKRYNIMLEILIRCTERHNRAVVYRAFLMWRWGEFSLLHIHKRQAASAKSGDHLG
jgi:hypothetical protein